MERWCRHGKWGLNIGCEGFFGCAIVFKFVQIVISDSAAMGIHKDFYEHDDHSKLLFFHCGKTAFLQSEGYIIKMVEHTDQFEALPMGEVAIIHRAKPPKQLVHSTDLSESVIVRINTDRLDIPHEPVVGVCSGSVESDHTAELSLDPIYGVAGEQFFTIDIRKRFYDITHPQGDVACEQLYAMDELFGES